MKQERKKKIDSTLKVGDKVKLTNKFIRNTMSTEGRKKWTVLGFWGSDNHQVLVNEPIAFPEMFDDLPENERPKWRSIEINNLSKVNI